MHHTLLQTGIKALTTVSPAGLQLASQNWSEVTVSTETEISSGTCANGDAFAQRRS